MTLYKIDHSSIGEGWNQKLAPFFDSDYYTSIQEQLTQLASETPLFPTAENVFRALELTRLEDVKVVILGQDPYHGEGQAHGLSFSVPDGIKFPPSLRNIFKELEEDCGKSIPESGDLTGWAQQGVLLLNSGLTVSQGKAGSHRKLGWKKLTDLIVQVAGAGCQKPTVFILWGNDAIKKSKWIDQEVHCVIESVHPSPLSAYRGFFGSRPFSRANDFLRASGRKEIQW